MRAPMGQRIAEMRRKPEDADPEAVKAEATDARRGDVVLVIEESQEAE